jgi:hypothetical protein
MKIIETRLSTNGFPTALNDSGDVYVDSEFIRNLQKKVPDTSNNFPILRFAELADNNLILNGVNEALGRIGIDLEITKLNILGTIGLDKLKYKKES